MSIDNHLLLKAVLAGCNRSILVALIAFSAYLEQDHGMRERGYKRLRYPTMELAEWFSHRLPFKDNTLSPASEELMQLMMGDTPDDDNLLNDDDQFENDQIRQFRVSSLK